MDVIVMGSGVIGVTTAYLLAKDGHKVKVIDRAFEPARETSFANGAQLSFSHIEPLSYKHSLKQFIAGLIKPGSFLTLGRIDKNLIRLISGLIKNSGKKKSLKIAKNLFEIGDISRKTLNQLIKDEGIDFNYTNTGTLHIFRTNKSFASAKKFSKFQKSIGEKLEILSLMGCVEKEPTLIKMVESRTLKGGIFYPNDASGDPYLFSKELAKICIEKYGVEFSFDDPIKNILTDSKKITGVNCKNGVYRADKYIYCLGISGLPLLKGINIETGIFPTLGASLSLPVDPGDVAPKMALTDTDNRMVYSRIGSTFRAAGGICITKVDGVEKKMFKFIKKRLRDTFLSYGSVEKALQWKNYRPSRSNSTPLICNVEKYQNLYLRKTMLFLKLLKLCFLMT